MQDLSSNSNSNSNNYMFWSNSNSNILHCNLVVIVIVIYFNVIDPMSDAYIGKINIILTTNLYPTWMNYGV